MISFARGAPALECLDADLLADCARAAIETDPSVLAYGPGGGYGAAARVARRRVTESIRAGSSLTTAASRASSSMRRSSSPNGPAACWSRRRPTTGR